MTPGRPSLADLRHAQEAVVLDGGMSNALEERGHDLTDPLWTARLLRDAPREIAAVHRAYFEAGARVATTASYQASVPGFVEAGLDRAAAEALIVRSVAVAKQTRDALAGDGIARWVAASVGPYGAYRADGSEYRGRYGVTATTLRDFHRPRLELLASAEPDLLAVETIPDIDEAAVLAELLTLYAIPAWFSFTINGLRTRAGQPLDEAFTIAATPENVFAVGVNCCAPSDVEDAVTLAVEVSGRPAVAYPNSGQTWTGRLDGWRDESSYDASRAGGWTAAGARYVGGCCRVGPEDIRALARALT